ncbi:hypothetical protein Tco_0119276, partial [Tanacetum coccineum]
MVMVMVIPIMPKQAVITDMMIFRVGDFFSAATIRTGTTGSTATTVLREEQLFDGESFGLGTQTLSLAQTKVEVETLGITVYVKYESTDDNINEKEIMKEERKDA